MCMFLFNIIILIIWLESHDSMIMTLMIVQSQFITIIGLEFGYFNALATTHEHLVDIHTEGGNNRKVRSSCDREDDSTIQ